MKHLLKGEGRGVQQNDSLADDHPTGLKRAVSVTRLRTAHLGDPSTSGRLAAESACIGNVFRRATGTQHCPYLRISHGLGSEYEFSGVTNSKECSRRAPAAGSSEVEMVRWRGSEDSNVFSFRIPWEFDPALMFIDQHFLAQVRPLQAHQCQPSCGTASRESNALASLSTAHFLLHPVQSLR